VLPAGHLSFTTSHTALTTTLSIARNFSERARATLARRPRYRGAPRRVGQTSPQSSFPRHAGGPLAFRSFGIIIRVRHSRCSPQSSQLPQCRQAFNKSRRDTLFCRSWFLSQPRRGNSVKYPQITKARAGRTNLAPEEPNVCSY